MIKMFIGDEEVVCNKEITITEEMLSTSSTILDNCYPKSWEQTKDYTSNYYYPEDYSKCKIYDDDEMIFCGVVKNTGDISLNPRNPHFCSLQILDFKTFLSEGETLDFVIANKTVEQAINMVIEAVKDYGFVLGNLNIFGKDDIIGAYSTQNKSAYDVFQYLADITQSKWNTRVIDENTIAIDFYDPTLMPRADNLKYTIDYFEKNKIKDINFNYGTRDYRNKQVMLSDKVYASIDYDETIIADGYAKTFTTQQKIGIIKQIKVNGIETTFATNTDKELGIEAEFYYTPDDTTIESTNLIGSGIIIEIIYVPLVQGRQIVYNYEEVERIRENTKRKGVIARYENRNDVQSSDELNKVGQAYLRYKGSAEINLNVLTYNKDLYKIGQIVHFEAPLPELSTDYMVKSKETQIISPGDFSEVFYTYKLVSNFNSENAINYFDNQRNKMVGNIGQGEYITRNIDIENASLIYFDNLDFAEIHNNLLDCELEAPFIL